MSLHYVYGPSGSGKSRWIYERVIADAMDNLDKRYIVLVPEQYTMSTQSLLVNMHPDHCIMNIDVLSFNRLAYRVFEELGQSMSTVLEDTGKALVLRRLAQEQLDNLGALKSNITKVSYINQVKSLISEMTQYNITPEVLREMMSYDAMSENFRRKAADLLVLYEAFLDFINGKYVTTESILQKLDEILDDSAMVADTVIVLDEFTGLTPVQYQLIEHMMRLSCDMYVAMNMDPKESVMDCCSEDELFAMTKEFTAHLNATAKRAGVQVADPVMLTGEKGRLKDSPVLNFLEQNIFRDTALRYEGTEDVNSSIRLLSLRNRREELKSCAIEINKLIRTGEYRYKDFAVVCPELENYRYLVPEIWKDFDIPYFLDSKSEIIFHPFTEAIDAVFEMYDRGFTKDSVFRFLRSGFSDLSETEIDELDNYAIASGLRGKKRYLAPFTVYWNAYDNPDALVYLNQLRERFIKPMATFDAQVGKGRHTVSEIAVALYNLLVSFDCERKLKESEAIKDAAGDSVKAREYGKIYKIVMDILDKMVAILGDQSMALEEFHDIYKVGLSNATIGLIPPAKDSVIIGDMERTRLDDIKVLFILGAADDAIPKKQENGGILSQLERELLLKKFEMAPSDKVKSFRQRYYIYMMLTAPSQKLIITYPRCSADGRGLNKSYLMESIEKLFVGLKTEDIEERALEDMLQNPKDANRLMIRLLAKVRDLGEEALDPQERKVLYSLMAMNKKTDKDFESLLSTVFFSYVPEQFSEDIMTAINEVYNLDETVSGSVSKFESYANCGYKYFMQYVLGAKDLEQYELSFKDIGIFYHAAIDKYSKLIKDRGKTWHDITAEECNQVAKEAIDYAIASMPKIASVYDPVWMHIVGMMKDTISYSLKAMTSQVKAGLFEPELFEEVVKKELINPVTGEKNALVKGVVDRVDINKTDHEVNVRIVDYKSSAHKIDLSKCFYGLSMQSPMYMVVIVDKLKEK